MPKGRQKTFSDKQLSKMRWLWQNTSLMKIEISEKMGIGKCIVHKWTRGLKPAKGIIKHKTRTGLNHRKPKVFAEMMHLWKTTDMGKKTIAAHLGLGETTCMKHLKGVPYNEGIDKISGQFPKGHKSWNKGTIGLTGPNKTSFKKGNTPHTLKYKIGEPQIVNRPEKGGKEVWTRIEERRLIEGTNGRVTNSQKRVLYSRYLWEKHYGPIPKGMVIYRKDGNPLNNKLDNFILITRKRLLRLNQNKFLESESIIQAKVKKDEMGRKS